LLFLKKVVFILKKNTPTAHANLPKTTFPDALVRVLPPSV
jgi:hypothetical protein